MSPISPSDNNMAMLHLEGQDMIRKRLDMDGLRERLNGGPDKKARLREACEGFETVFIQKLWEQMRKNVRQSSYLHSRDEHMYQAMYDGEFSKKMTQAGGIGLADMLYEQLSQRLGESSRTTSTRNDPRLPIIPSASSVTGIDSIIKPLNGVAGQAGIPLHNKNIRPLYEDAPDSAAPAGPEAAAPVAAAGPEFVPYSEDLELEELSQALLAEELAAPENSPAYAPARSKEGALSMNPADAALLESALRQNMAATPDPIPATGHLARFGTAFATETANPADSAVVSDTNNSPRS